MSGSDSVSAKIERGESAPAVFTAPKPSFGGGKGK